MPYLPQIMQNKSLKALNTFGVDAKARYYGEFFNKKEIRDFFSKYNKEKPYLLLGGGSNILFTKDFDGYVLKISLKGIEIEQEDTNNVVVNVKAGEEWDHFVNWCTDRNYGGLENLSMIPGQVGTSPIQNIGAYGSEVKNTIISVNTFNVEKLSQETFDNADCQFAYRNSIFKSKLKNTHIITEVRFRLSKKPVLNTNYKAVKEALQEFNIQDPDIRDVRKAVCYIRENKLPDPKILGNAGSFFKNPVIKDKTYENLKSIFPDIVAYKENSNHWKIAAAWLIDSCGWKCKRIGNAGVHNKQALVIVNHGGASGAEIFALAQKIRHQVYEKFKIKLETEVNII